MIGNFASGENEKIRMAKIKKKTVSAANKQHMDGIVLEVHRSYTARKRPYVREIESQ